ERGVARPSAALEHGRRKRQCENARLLSHLRVASLFDLCGDARAVHHSRRESRRSKPIQAAGGNVPRTRLRVGPSRPCPAEIPQDATAIICVAVEIDVGTYQPTFTAGNASPISAVSFPREATSPSPNCPILFRPQHLIVPSSKSAHVLVIIAETMLAV